MEEALQKAKDGVWTDLVKHFGMYGTPSTSDDSTLDVEFRKKAQALLPEIQKTWLVDDWTLPSIQALPKNINTLLASINNPLFESYPIYALRTEVPPLVASVSAIKKGDVFVDAIKSVDAVNLIINEAFITTIQSAQSELEKPEASDLKTNFNKYTEAWELVMEKAAGYFFGVLSSKVNGDGNEE